jgi:hypothetical protein
MIKSYQEYIQYLVQEGLYFEELNEKRILSRYDFYKAIKELGVTRDKAENDELISIILQAIEPFVTKRGFIIDMGSPMGVWK